MKNTISLSPSKKQKKEEALQELIRIRPDLKGNKIYFFPTLNKYFEGVLFYNIKESKAQVYCNKRDQFFDTFSQWINSLRKRGLFKGYKSAVATIFLEPNPTSSSIATILREPDYKSYWKKSLLINTSDILKYFEEQNLLKNKFAGTTIQEINEGLEFKFPMNKYQPEKKLIIFFKSGLYSYEMYVLNKVVQNIYLPFPTKAMKRTFDDIVNIVRYIFYVEICQGQSTIGFEDVVQICGTQLVSNEKEHTPFAFLEKNRKIYRRQNKLIVNLKERLNQKIKNEEEEVSNEIANIVHIVSEKVNNKNIEISNLHPIFQELICIQTGKLKETKYHPIRSGSTAYNTIKTIMRLPSISTLKNYIGKYEQSTGWQDKIAQQLLTNLTINNIWGYGRVGFFSHDSFKIQKGLLWNQRKNCYVGYLDFEDETNEYQEFALQCQHEIESFTSSSDNVIPNKQKHNLATQVHQFIWHSITHNFSFPISYYGINNITTHNLNTLIFELAAKLECIEIHTIGSVCDGAGENRAHIKSFDWYASKWTCGDSVEVNFNKDNKSFYAAKIIESNFEKTKFIVSSFNDFEKIEVDRAYIRPPMPLKLEWKINEICEYKSPKDNQWYFAKIIDYNLLDIIIEIPETMEKWKVFNQCINDFLRPVYNTHELLTTYKTINPITGEDWFFISDPTHVFKKLRNNLSKSCTGEKNCREITIGNKEINWKHIKGVYEHTNQHATAKATKLTKRYIWLTSWSKMRVDLAEQTLSKEVEDALESIDELKFIFEGTQEFIKYSRKYRQIMHSKISFCSLNDPRISTLKEICNWFVYGDKQKKNYKEWISSQCQFDLILSINGFIGMLEFILKKYLGAIVQPKRISQDTLEGLFGTIREMGGDSSTQILKSYGYTLNKYQITALASSEIKSINYGKADCNEFGIANLNNLLFFKYIRNYRKDKKSSLDGKEKNNYCQKHYIKLIQLSSWSRNIFENILSNNLIMGKINIPLKSYSNNVDQENLNILHFQNERPCKAIPKRIGIQWLTNWSSHFEIYINNYKCSGIWYQGFLIATNLNGSSNQRLVAYLLLQNVIKFTFSNNAKQNSTHLSVDPHLISENNIDLEPAKASKFAYIIGWIIYKLTKSDNLTKSHSKFEAICTHLMVLNSEKVIYDQGVRSQVTNIIPGPEFLKFMYKMESIILLLFEKYEEFGSNILLYIHNNLLCNLLLVESFYMLFNISNQILVTNNTIDIEKYKLIDGDKEFLYERIITIYMRSKQKSWRSFKEFIPEKGTSSLRENLKAMKKDTKRVENNLETIKKSNLPKDPKLGLNQLQIWAHLENAEKEFSKIFLVSELQWLLWAFEDNLKNKRKKNLVPLILDHLKKRDIFF
ncbi:hypothetical protein Glove_359g27 [Diversispora epigaea]|uniref:Agenet domain-containing protein n=1 Tax=Diversispora epigaea TaxID=1348612 RepID=A0A397HAR2_9GLOM|nr:hypothetical protein Glove_359g27 [Diversispora epigaea]